LSGNTILFLSILLLETALIVFLILCRRIVFAHDGFQHLSLQYCFLNNAVQTGEIAQWLPFLTHGSPANWWYAGQSGLFQSFLLIVARCLDGLNLLPFVYLGFLFDELVLLLGTWLLAKHHFSSLATRTFVAATVVFSAIWMDQPGFNFHAYYATPLALHFFRRFMETSRWRNLFLCGNLFAMQAATTVYPLPVILLASATYMISCAILLEKESRQRLLLECRRTAARGVTTIVLILVSFALVYLLLKSGTEQIVNYAGGRANDNSVPLVAFLTYGVDRQMFLWLETVFGVSLGIDYTLYAGILTVAFCLLACTRYYRKENLVFIVPAVLLILLSSGGFTSFLLYKIWPMMKYYRHLSYVSVVAKLFICFLAGAGFDRFLNDNRRFAPTTMAVATALIFWSIVLAWLSSSDAQCSSIVERMGSTGLVNNAAVQSIADTRLDLQLTAAWSALGGLLLLVCCSLNKCLVNSTPTSTIIPPFRSCAVALLLILQCLDLYGYKWRQAIGRTTPATEAEYELNRFQPAPYPERRMPTLYRNSRAAVFEQYLDHHPVRLENWSASAYLFQDLLGSDLRVDHWPRPLDDLMRAYWRQPLNRPDVHPSGLTGANRLEFPSTPASALKVAGLTNGKLQVFDRAFCLDRREDLARLMADSSFSGDILFLSTTAESQWPAAAETWNNQIRLSSSTHMAARRQVDRFDSNNLELTLEIPSTAFGSAWLLYCDNWHPYWSASVNGVETPVFNAMLAYKAIQVPTGKSRVRFTYGTRLSGFLFWFLAINQLAWFIATFWLVAVEFAHGRFQSASHTAAPEEAAVKNPAAVDADAIRHHWKTGIGLALITLAFVLITKNDLLLVAAGKCSTAPAKALLWMGANPNTRDADGVTPLIFAAMEKNPVMIECLLSNGADPNLRRNDQTTALANAAAKAELFSVRALLNGGAEVGTVELGCATQGNSRDILEILLRAMTKNPKIQTIRDIEGRTPLHYAVTTRSHTLVGDLLKQGIPVDARTVTGLTPLMLAVDDGNTAAAGELLQWKADVNARDKDGKTPLMHATLKGHTAMVQLLIDRRAQVNATNQKGLTPLMFAAMRGHTTAVTALLRAGATVNASDPNGWTSLLIATANRHVSVMQTLIQAGANMNAQTQDGWTPLKIATTNNDDAASDCLRSAGARL
jgi:ankyrin repeat protein